MPSTPFESFASPYLVLPTDNIDTDQIIPARFLKTTERTGLGRHAFQDWRYAADGAPDPRFPLNTPLAAEARVLVTGRNFGCGSSREHAVWALLGAGLRVVVSSRFADIFRGNALGNGLLPVEVDDDVVARLVAVAATAAREGTAPPRVAVDLERRRLTLPDGATVEFPVAPFARHRLLHGIDELEFLLGAEAEIGAYERREARAPSTLGRRGAA